MALSGYKKLQCFDVLIRIICCRGGSRFIVPYHQFVKSVSNKYSTGMRFSLRFETEDATERCTGIITGISEIDPVNWPGSKWKCLMVSILYIYVYLVSGVCSLVSETKTVKLVKSVISLVLHQFSLKLSINLVLKL